MWVGPMEPYARFGRVPTELYTLAALTFRPCFDLLPASCSRGMFQVPVEQLQLVPSDNADAVNEAFFDQFLTALRCCLTFRSEWSDCLPHCTPPLFLMYTNTLQGGGGGGGGNWREKIKTPPQGFRKQTLIYNCRR